MKIQMPVFTLEKVLIDNAATYGCLTSIIQNPSSQAMQLLYKRKREELDAQTLRNDILQFRDKYSELDWKGNYKFSCASSYWNEASLQEKWEVLGKCSQDYSKISRLVLPLKQYYQKEGFTNEQLTQLVQLYLLLVDKSKIFNNSTLFLENISRFSYDSILNNKVIFWRFVCMPEIELVVDNTNTFIKWKYNFNNQRYDTLNTALEYDFDLINSVENLGIGSKIFFVLDDWEVLFLRAIKNGKNTFTTLSSESKQSAIDQLELVRKDIYIWVQNNVEKFGIKNFGVKFFSEMVPYSEMLDLMDSLSLELVDTKVLNAEEDFVAKSGFNSNMFEIKLKALRRVRQYAVEGILISEDSDLKKGLYLNSEYPTQQVWQKLTLLCNVPTLFYVSDKQVKNV